MNNLTVSKRLILAFSIMLGIIISLAIGTWYLLAENKREIDIIVNENNAKISHAYKLRGAVNLVARSVRNYIIYTDAEMRKKMVDRIANARKDYDESFTQLEALVVTEKAKQLISELKASRAETRPLFNSVIAQIDEGKAEEAVSTLRNKVQGAQDKWFDVMQNMIDLQSKQNSDAVESMNQQYALAIKLLIISVLLAIAISVALAWAITRSIVRQLGGEPSYAVQITEKIAAGNLAVAVNLRDGDNNSLLYAINAMRLSLANIVTDVRTSADAITHGSGEIASGNMDLSSRTEQQAGALEETASSMEELNSTVRQNADNARQANQLAQSASSVAIKGGEVVGEVIKTMGNIDASAKKIVDIISVIDGIAFQTNILALNAAVEAARAGEQGRGFAVVASEVRNLAQRSAAAAKEVKSLIDESVENVEIGSKLVNQAGTTINEVVESVRRVTDVMSEISAASQEQTAGIDQISTAITQMDQVTQQNAALVEEAAAAAASLEDQANKLMHTVSMFQIDGAQSNSQPAVKNAVTQIRAVKANPPKPRPAAPLKRVTSSLAAGNAGKVDSAEWDEF
ncbi:methyl-accepting chemotaxis protein [Undibacterium sp. KW1]|uniref:methyl-accepting chemotaxis protein n=1 Tax=Undibacterium sp. KW1 TaxID=2058624 RepID=UPI001331C9CE|nr:methyl-accepting chemotaxis protein [Undibacterium sp. KW1]BBB59936.1 methyl-accepting chemotaxis protein [Undibacterium sp. KW1]